MSSLRVHKPLSAQQWCELTERDAEEQSTSAPSEDSTLWASLRAITRARRQLLRVERAVESPARLRPLTSISGSTKEQCIGALSAVQSRTREVSAVAGCALEELRRAVEGCHQQHVRGTYTGAESALLRLVQAARATETMAAASKTLASAYQYPSSEDQGRVVDATASVATAAAAGARRAKIAEAAINALVSLIEEGSVNSCLIAAGTAVRLAEDAHTRAELALDLAECERRLQALRDALSGSNTTRGADELLADAVGWCDRRVAHWCAQIVEANIHAAETKFINDSRGHRLELQSLTPQTGTRAQEGAVWSTSSQTVGLAFSGGGTRSATFCLGVAQVLAREKILKHVDYLSTVSGGSYMGAHLVSRIRDLGLDEVCKRLVHRPGTPEHEDLRKRRHFASYLSPDGSPAYVLEVLALLARAIATNLALFFPLLVWMTLWVSAVAGPNINAVLASLKSGKGLGPSEFVGRLYPITTGVLAVGLIFSLLVLVAARAFQPSVAVMNRIRSLEAVGWAIALACFGAETIPALVVVYRRAADQLGWTKPEVTFARSLLAGLMSLSPYLLTGTLLRVTRPLVVRAGSIVLGLLGPCVFVWTLVSAVAFSTRAYDGASQVEVPTVALRWNLPSVDPLHCGGVVAGVVVIGAWLCLQAVHSRQTESLKPQKSLKAQFLCFVWLLLLWAGIALGAVLFAWLGLDKELAAFCGGRWSGPVPERVPIGIAWAAFFVSAATFVLVDANHSSLLWFYRQRLEAAFLAPEAGAPPAKLSALTGNGAPLLIVNAAVNVTADARLAGRGSDFFSFTPHVIGSDATGYAATSQTEDVDRRLDLSTIVAISGAAVSPNMGVLTSRPLAVLMSLLGLRLCYWLPNPRRVTAIEGDGRRWGPLPGRAYLARELVGKLSARHPFVNVSDGGHIENLGVRELLRRRCRLIIAVDGECDPRQSCAALATLVRYARIDWGIDIQIDPTELHGDEQGLARTHAVIGKILYPQNEVGHLIYLKASLTGDENVYVKDYARANPAFPHQTTADQFFDEQQFEAYRALGHHVAEEVFQQMKPADAGGSAVDVQMAFIDRCVAYVTGRLRGGTGREPEFVDLQRELAAIERELERPEHREYAAQLFPELLGGATARVRAITPAGLSLCNRQLQFMENVFLSLRLDDQRQRDHALNRGWLNLFRRWARAPWFRLAFLVASPMYSGAFERFCEELNDALRLGWRMIHYRPATEEGEARMRAEQARCLPGRALPPDAVTHEAWLELGAHRFSIGFLVLGGQARPRTLVFAYVEPPLRNARVLERMLRAYQPDSAEEFDWDADGVPEGTRLGLRALLDRAWGPPSSTSA